MADDIVANYSLLFRGRTECYGAWSGGCIYSPVIGSTWQKHLTDGPHIGIYPSVNMDGVANCWWGCTDIDYDDYAEAKRLQDAFAAVDVTAWTERTRKGWHVWVFSYTAVPADHMRRMFLACHQVANSVPREVNPKQVHLADGQVGNYVRLPYPSGDNAVERVMVEHDERVRLRDFVERALANRVLPDHIERLADYYQPPQPPPIIAAPPSHDMTEAARQLTPLGRVVFRSGPIAGQGDRSTSLATLAHQCYRSGLAAGDALMLLEDADLRWGKFMVRGSNHELEKLVARAYGHTPST